MIPFTKIQGIGNDFVCIDLIANPFECDWSALSRALCDRHFGIGADGLILVDRGTLAPFRMRMFNPDGSESEMCGNGTRCVALLLQDRGYVGAEFELEVWGGVFPVCRLDNNTFQVAMGSAKVQESNAKLGFQGLSATLVSVGNPHAVIFVSDTEGVDLEGWGSAIETLPQFPDRTNVHFVSVTQNELTMITWERGTGVTLACGSGACAVARAAADRAGESSADYLIH
ncbi:MAG: diaminopimelate epimerase, partial [Fimbriimonadaceae bacterium]